jgi:hypothetical protein
MANFVDTIRQNNPAVVRDINQLTTAEIEFLLSLIKDSTFKGEQVEIVYNTTFKLQQQYTNNQK